MRNQFLIALTMLLFCFSLIEAQTMSDNPSNLYLVKASNGPGFTSPQEAVMVLENAIIPSFEQLLKLKENNVLIGGGVPLGDRAVIFIIQAKSNAEVDKILRTLPLWPALQWDVTPLESIEGRLNREKMGVNELKKMLK